MIAAPSVNPRFALEDDILSRMIEVRQAIHACPELSNRESVTASLLRRELETAGLVEIAQAAGTGLVVDIEGKGQGTVTRTLAIRGELDALPIAEKTNLPFASRKDGIMHACGHDAHAAMVLAAALSLYRHHERFRGTVRCIFQPAEEAEPLGARRILEEGHLADVDAVLGGHVDPLIESGRMGVRAGAYACSADEFDIEFLGKASHAARPHDGVDAITVAAGFIQEVQKIPARQTDPAIPLVITIGAIHGGTAHNILAASVVLKGTIRTMSEEVRALAHRRLRDLAEGLARAHGARANVEVRRGEPVLVNDPRMVALIEQAGREVAGEDAVFSAEPWTASDDFAFYSQIKPSVYFRLGIRNEAKGYVNGLHHPEFAVDEAVLPLGAAVLVRAAQRFLNPPS